MTFRQRLWRQPQSLWLRRALFQIHLWTGLGLGVYMLVISITGSAIVFRSELMQAFTRLPVLVAGSGDRLTLDELKLAAQQAYPRLTVLEVWETRNPDQAIEIWLDGNGGIRQRLFDPYTGQDLGEAVPPGLRFTSWLIDLHVNLLYGETGRILNALGAVFLILLAMTGMVIWWPGTRSWRRSLTVQLRANWKRLNWSLHSAIGFWTLLFVFLWGITGLYVSYPTPFHTIVDHLQPYDDDQTEPRSGDTVLVWLARLHFGRFAGVSVKLAWVIFGLVPAVLFVTGALMWWNRVVRRGGSSQAHSPESDVTIVQLRE